MQSIGVLFEVRRPKAAYAPSPTRGREERRSPPPMKFFSFWRSQASFRVRIALNLKKVPTEVVFIDLDSNAHHTNEFQSVNPQMALPALVEDDGTTLFQSLAIIEYLEETHPTPPLLPKDAH